MSKTRATSRPVEVVVLREVVGGEGSSLRLSRFRLRLALGVRGALGGLGLVQLRERSVDVLAVSRLEVGAALP